MKAIHNFKEDFTFKLTVVLYPKDTEKWKQFTTVAYAQSIFSQLFCIPKILKNESNSQRNINSSFNKFSCFVSQRYWKMKAIHNTRVVVVEQNNVVLYPKDTEKWKQFTTLKTMLQMYKALFCIPKILKNESNSQLCIQCFKRF